MSSPLPMALGKAIHRLRQKAGYSQDVLAAAAGAHRTYIPQVETGSRNITIVSLEKIAKALKLTAGELLMEAEKEQGTLRVPVLLVRRC
jgi:transcriptional regulator with XRE-family HTH domain